MDGACADLRVLDLSDDLAGSLASMIFADFGAEVIRIGDQSDGTELSSARLLLDRGKKRVAPDLDSASGLSQLLKLVTTVDVVVASDGRGQREDADVGYAWMAALNPALVYCSITAFGDQGPLAGIRADDSLVMARAGIYRDQPGWFSDGSRPIYRASKDGSYFAAMLAVQGILAALRVRDLTGTGQLVKTSLLQAIACRQNPKVRWLLRDGEELPREERANRQSVQEEMNTLPHHRDPREASLIGMLVECSDGRWIVHSHTEPHFFPAWIDVLGMSWIWEDERFTGAPYRFTDVDAKVELLHLLESRMKERTAAEWMDAYLKNGNVCGDVVQTTREALQHPQLLAINGTVEFEDIRVGRVLQVGPLANIPGAPAAIRPPATSEEDLDRLMERKVDRFSNPGSIQKGTKFSAGPLDGVTIVEAAYYYATPFATALLSDLGARVIKIEPLRGDPYRALAGGAGDGDPVLNLGHNNMVRAMQGKESIALDLKDRRGQEILHRLVAGADIFVHSFRRGVPESLGIDEATLRKVNPGLVYQYGASYGSVGPYSRQPAIDPVIAAFAGTTAYQAGSGNPPLTETGADPVAAAGHAAAMMLGLHAQRRTGQGQYVESAMILSNIYLNLEEALSFEGMSSRPPVDPRQFGTGAVHRLYQCAPGAEAQGRLPHGNPNSCWVFLSAVDDQAFEQFCTIVGRKDLVQDPRFSSRDGRDENGTLLTELLAELFLTNSAAHWEELLLVAGGGCVIADALSHFAFVHEDPQAKAIGLMETTEHPSFGGTYWRHAPLVTCSSTPGHGRPYCELGEHTQDLLRELGYDESAIAELEQAAIVKSAPKLARATSPT